MRHRSLPFAAAVIALAGCGPDIVTSPAGGVAAEDAEMSHGLVSVGDMRRATPATPCREGKHRDFDFWLGTWQVTGPGGGNAGFNEISSNLDGCALMEDYSAAPGYRGRSINMYDPSTDAWFQTWVDNTGVNLRMSGGLQGGDMVMSGFGPGGLNRTTWSQFTPATVRQHWEVSSDNGDTWSTLFDGYYAAATSIPSPGPATATPCNAPAYHAFDAWHGDWRVSAGNGLSLGRAMIRSDLDGCLNEVVFESNKGYRSTAFISYGRAAQRWFMTQMDSEGNRLQLAGTAGGGVGVLSGQESGPGQSATAARISWEVVAVDHLRQRWFSSQDGIEWRETAVFHFHRI